MPRLPRKELFDAITTRGLGLLLSRKRTHRERTSNFPTFALAAALCFVASSCDRAEQHTAESLAHVEQIEVPLAAAGSPALADLLAADGSFAMLPNDAWLACDGRAQQVIRFDGNGRTFVRAGPGAGPGEIPAQARCVRSGRSFALVADPPFAARLNFVSAQDNDPVRGFSILRAQELLPSARRFLGAIDGARLLVADQARTLALSDQVIDGGAIVDSAGAWLVPAATRKSAAGDDAPPMPLGPVVERQLVYRTKATPIGVSIYEEIIPSGRVLVPFPSGVWVVDRDSGRLARYDRDGVEQFTTPFPPSANATSRVLDDWYNEWMRSSATPLDSARAQAQRAHLKSGRSLYFGRAVADASGTLLVERPGLNGAWRGAWMLVDTLGRVVQTLALDVHVELHGVDGRYIYGKRALTNGAAELHVARRTGSDSGEVREPVEPE